MCSLGDKVCSLNVPDDADMDMLMQMLRMEFAEQHLVIQHNGKDLGSGVAMVTKLSEMGMKDNDILMLSKKPARLNISDVRLDQNPDKIMALVREHPHLQTQFNNSDPELGTVIASGDTKAFARLIMSRMMAHHKTKFDKQQEQARFEADPDNEDNQKAMMERIRLENIQANMETAMEELPEAFGRVFMLYVNLEINGHCIKAFVDSGAQSTIMSVNCAERCGLTRLIDTRYAGEARGVGTCKILGRVHIAQMKIGETFFPISITVLEKNDVDFLFGLDMLKRYRCMIDLADNCLRIDGGRENISFLAENALPSADRGTTPEEQGAAMDVEKDSLVEQGGIKAEASAPPSSSSSSVSAPVVTVSVPAQESAPSPGPSSAPSPAPTPAPTPTLTPAPTPDAVAQLVAMGFTAQQATAALVQTDGNVDLAASILLAQHDQNYF